MKAKQTRKILSFLLALIIVAGSISIPTPVMGAELEPYPLGVNIYAPSQEYGEWIAPDIIQQQEELVLPPGVEVFLPELPIVGDYVELAPSIMYVPDDVIPFMPFTIFPSQYNLERNWLSPVVDQGRISICWAVASINAIETSTYKNTGVLQRFSIHHLIHATSNAGGNRYGYNRAPGSAGNSLMVMSYVMRGRLYGVVSHYDDPFPSAPASMPARPFAQTAAIPASYHIPSAYQITNSNMPRAVRDALVKQAIMDFGAVYVAMQGPQGGAFNARYNTWNTNSGPQNHAMTIVGWDDYFCRTLFNVRPPGDGAWLVQNTWGTWWGDGGFLWVSYHDHWGSRTTYAFSPAVSFPTDIANIYEFDIPGVWGWSTGINHQTNIFDAVCPNEILTSVRVMNNMVGDQVDIFFIPNFNDLSDLYLVSQGLLPPIISFTADRAGFHNIDLPIHAQQAVGYRFALVTSNSSGRIPVSNNALGGQTLMYRNGWMPSPWAAAIKGVTSLPASGGNNYRIAGSGMTRFNSLIVGYAASELHTRTVYITNTGTGTVTLEQPYQLTNFTIGTLSRTTLAPGEYASLTVRPNENLPIGSYSEVIFVRGSNNAATIIPVGVSVVQGSQLSDHGVTIVGEVDFGARRVGYTNVPVHTFHLTNHTGATRNISAVYVNNPIFTVRGMPIRNPGGGVGPTPNLPNGGTMTFTIEPVPGLPPGIHVQQIPIATMLNGTLVLNITARFVVYESGEASAISISAPGVNPANPRLRLSPVPLGAAPMNHRTVTVTNIGDNVVTLEQPSFVNFNAGPLSTSVLQPGEQAMFSLSSRDGLSSGIYIEPITVMGSGNASASLLADFDILLNNRLAHNGVSVSEENWVPMATALDFGVINVGATSPTRTFFLTNNSGGQIAPIVWNDLTSAWVSGGEFATNGYRYFTVEGILSDSFMFLANGLSRQFTITPRPGLPPGRYYENIIIRRAGNNGNDFGLILTASFTVVDTVILSVTPSVVDFGDIVAGNVADIVPRTVTVTNNSTGTVTLEGTTPNAYFEASGFSTDTLLPGGMAVFTVWPTENISGIVNQTIGVLGSGGVSASFTASANATEISRIEASVLPAFRTLMEGYQQSQIQTVTVRNTGSTEITLVQPTATYFEIGNLSTSVLGRGESATFIVRTLLGLYAGDYSETIYIYGSNGTSASVTAEFSVMPTSAYVIEALEYDICFGIVLYGYPQVADVVVTIQNVGLNSVDLVQPFARKFEIGDLSHTTIAPTETATFTIRPVDDLYVFEHYETIVIRGSGGASTFVDVRFVVEASTGITAHGLYSFGTLEVGYEQPPAQTVTITNIGTEAVTIEQPISFSFEIGTLSATFLPGGESATFTVRPVSGLAAGEHDETIRITASDGSEADIFPHFVVTETASETAPEIVSVMPTGTNAAISGNIVITFDESMNTAVGTVSIGGTALTGGIWNSMNTVFTVAYSGLTYDMQYTITISNFADVAGNVISPNPQTRTFTTMAQPDGPYVMPLIINLDLYENPNETLIFSMGPSGNEAEQAILTGFDLSVISPSSNSTTGASIVVTGLSIGSTDITVSFTGGDLDTPIDMMVAVTVTDTIPVAHAITINGGTASHITAIAGQIISITAGPAPAGQRFDRWTTASPGVTFANANNASTTFIMPNNPVTITAQWVPIDTNGGGAGGGDGGPGGPDGDGWRPPAPTINASISPATITFDKNGDGDIIVTLYRGSFAFRNIRFGNVPLTRNVEFTVNSNIFTICSEYLSTLELGSQIFTFEMSGGTNPRLTIIIIDTTPEAPEITQMPLPVPESLPFIDVAQTSWYYPFVRMVWEHQLFTGTSANIFMPQGNMTRAMFVQVLANLEGINLSIYNTRTISSFYDTDTNAWYFGAVEWAAGQGLVNGIGGGNFAPNQTITRQEMAVLLYRYISSRGMVLPQGAIAPFIDQDNISPWAVDEVRAIQAAGIISGHPDGRFAPQDTATRAEVATIFAQFLQVYQGILR